MYKLVAIDLDGTLLKDDKTISTNTVEAIKRAKKMGVHVVIATGRPYEGIIEIKEQLKVEGIEDYFVNFNGALVTSSSNEIIYQECLNGLDLLRLSNEADRVDSNIHAFIENEGLVTRDKSEYTDLEATINKIEYKIADLKKYSKEDVVVKIMLIDKKEILDRTVERLDKSLYNDYQVVRSAPWFLEFVHKDVDKFNGIKKLADYLNIKTEEIICIGDAGNDLSMILGAGLGVAMANGFDDVKEKADYITMNDNNHDGVKEVFEKFIF